MRKPFCTALIAAIFVMAATTSSHAQWIMAAHAAKNHIERMTQKSNSGGYDVAIVMLEAPADRVYDKTLASLKEHPEVAVTKDNKRKGQIEFRKGDEVAGFNITPITDKLTQLIIASNVNDKAPDATPLVVNAVLRVCKEVNVVCTQEP
jgi:hypothetical protein